MSTLNKATRVLLLAFAVFAHSVAGTAHAQEETPTPEPTLAPSIFRVGLLVSTRGEDLKRSEAVRSGATLATETINREGGIHSNPFRLEIEESSGEAKSQVKAFSQLMDYPDMVAVITAGEEDATVVRNLAEFHRVLVLSNSMRVDPLRNASYMIRIGRSLPNARDAFLEFIKRRKITRVGVMLGDEEWAEPIMKELTDGEHRRHFKVIINESIDSFRGSLEPKYRDILNSGAIELLFSATSPENQNEVVSRLARRHVEAPLALFYACSSRENSIELPDYPGSIYSADINTSGPESQRADVAKAFKSRFPGMELSVDALIGYDAVMMVAKANKSGAGTAEAVRDYIIDSKSYVGSAGVIDFSKDGDSKRPVSINIVDSGSCEPLLLSSEE